MITDQDIRKLEKTFATKKELGVQTERIDSLVYEVGDLKVLTAEILEKIDHMEEFFGAKLDRFLQNIDDQRLDSAAGAVILARHERQILALADHMEVILPV